MITDAPIKAAWQFPTKRENINISMLGTYRLIHNKKSSQWRTGRHKPRLENRKSMLTEIKPTIKHALELPKVLTFIAQLSSLCSIPFSLI